MANAGELVLKRREAKEFFRLGENPLPHQIKEAYRRLALQYHPDRNPQNVEEATREMAKITGLYEILLIPETDEERHIKQFYEGFII